MDGVPGAAQLVGEIDDARPEPLRLIDKGAGVCSRCWWRRRSLPLVIPLRTGRSARAPECLRFPA